MFEFNLYLKTFKKKQCLKKQQCRTILLYSNIKLQSALTTAKPIVGIVFNTQRRSATTTETGSSAIRTKKDFTFQPCRANTFRSINGTTNKVSPLAAPMDHGQHPCHLVMSAKNMDTIVSPVRVKSPLASKWVYTLLASVGECIGINCVEIEYLFAATNNNGEFDYLCSNCDSGHCSIVHSVEHFFPMVREKKRTSSATIRGIINNRGLA